MTYTSTKFSVLRFQGEGPLTGHAATFLRLAGCNLHCNFCDTKYTWNFGRMKHENGDVIGMSPYRQVDEVHRMTLKEVYDQLETKETNLVVITGGEPMLQQEALSPLVRDWCSAGLDREVQVETNGTVLPEGFMEDYVMYVVSPKLSFAQAGPKAVDVDYAQWAEYGAVFKFVVRGPEDLAEIASLELPPELVYIQPEGTTPEVIIARQRLLAQPVLEYGWNLSTRLHVLIWGNERAR